MKLYDKFFLETYQQEEATTTPQPNMADWSNGLRRIYEYTDK